jgi:hypothetical protein
MVILNLNSEIHSDGRLRLDVPTNLPPGNIELIVVINHTSTKESKAKKYEFSDLIGKLSWKKDALAVQKELRNEVENI